MKLILICGYCESEDFNFNRGTNICSQCGEELHSIHDYDIKELEED